MRKALSVVLAGLLIVLPVEQVLAQAVRQEAVSVQQSVPPDGAAHRLRVPPPTENAAQFLRTNPVDALLPTPNPGVAVGLNPGVDELVPMPLSRGGKITLIVVGVLLVIAAIVIVRCFDGDRFCLD